MIAVDDQATTEAAIGTLGKGQLVSMPAPTTGLTRVCGIHRHEPTTGTCCLVRQIRAELAPRGITDALGQTVMVDHPVNLQVFDTDDLEAVDDLPAVLMGEVLAPIGDPLVNPSYHLPALLPGRAALCFPAHPALGPSQVVLIASEEPGIGDSLPRAQRGEGGQAHVDTHCLF